MVACVGLDTARASAWNPEPWGGELISGYVYTSASQSRDRFGRTVDLDVYNKQIVQTYVNLGLTPSLALIGTFDWQDAQIVGPGVNTQFSKPSSISAGLQYQLRRAEGHAVALSLSYVDGIDFPDELITIENRDPAVEIRGLWGESRTLWQRNMFAEAQLSTRISLGVDYASSQAQLTIGGNLSERLMILGKSRYTDVAGGVFQRFDIAPQSRAEVEGSAVYRIRKQDYIELGYTATVSGQGAVRERGVKLGFWTKF